MPAALMGVLMIKGWASIAFAGAPMRSGPVDLWLADRRLAAPDPREYEKYQLRSARRPKANELRSSPATMRGSISIRKAMLGGRATGLP